MKLPGRSNDTRHTNSTLVNRLRVASWLELWLPKLLIEAGELAICCGKRLSLRRMSSKQPTNPKRTSSRPRWTGDTGRTSAPTNTSLVSKLMTSLTPGAAPWDRWVSSTVISAVFPCRSKRTSCQRPSLTETPATRTKPSPLPQSKRYWTWWNWNQ